MADQRSVFVAFDLDSGGGTENVLGINLRLTASGGSIEALGSKVAASSIPVVIASDQGDLGVDNAGVFVVQEDGAALTALQLIDDVVAVLGTTLYTEATTSGNVIGVVRNDTLAALANTDNEIAPLQVDQDGALYTRIASSVALDVSAATVTVDSELPTAASLTDTLANPTAPAVGSHLMGFDRVNTDWTRIDGVIDGQVVNAAGAGFLQVGSDGTNYQVITTDASGHLQVDVLTGGGTDTPTNPFNDTFTNTIAPNTPTNIDSTDDDDRKLSWIDVWSSVAWKGEVFTVDNGAESVRKGVTGGAAMQAVQYTPTHRDFIQVGATAGVDAFRLKFTNLDDNLTADSHVVFHYED